MRLHTFSKLIIFLILCLGIVACGSDDPVTQAESSEIVDFSHNENIPIDGSPDAPVQVVEFIDFACTSCISYHKTEVKKWLQGQFGDQMAFQVRNYAFLTPDSQKAGEAAQCAHEQGFYWVYHDALLERTDYDALKVDDLKRYANLLGLNPIEFDLCLDSNKYTGYVARDTQMIKLAGGNATPTFVINGKVVDPKPEALAQAIRDELGLTVE